MVGSDELSLTFSALADPTRRTILARLTQGPATVGELAEPFAMSGPAVSKHLRVLEHAALLTRSRDAQRRPCRLDARPIGQVVEWAEDYRRYWEDSYERLDDYLQRLQGHPRGGST